MTARFNKENKDYYIDLQFVPGDAWDEKLKAAQAAGTAPDAYMINYNKILHAASQGLLMPLNDYISQEAFDDLHDNIREMITYKLKLRI
jgi:multiple sugar transport system substrate-binding protein